ncbi:MAG: hypothetical protein ABI539_01180 [Acidobacteriota bacterium]
MRETEPTSITQGQKSEWTKQLCDYPASAWDLEYRFRGAGPGIDVAATADGDSFEIGIDGTDTVTLTIGSYQWQAWVTEKADTDNTFPILTGRVRVLRGFTSGETADIDMRSPAKVMLDSLDAALLRAGSADVVEYEISTPAGSTHVKRGSRSEVLSQRKYYAAIVAREIAAERLKNTGKFGRPVGIRMWDQ